MPTARWRWSSSFQSTLSVRRATIPTPESLPDGLFQSTLSVRRATCVFVVMILSARFQSTLSVRRATLFAHGTAQVEDISIHALREESDVMRERVYDVCDISIHALREESDVSSPHTSATTGYFNPRSP